MHIDFALPSNGTYNNAGSSRQLANYLEHEDLERMEKGLYTDSFFLFVWSLRLTIKWQCIFSSLSERLRSKCIFP